jgi:hypothetical protein
VGQEKVKNKIRRAKQKAFAVAKTFGTEGSLEEASN